MRNHLLRLPRQSPRSKNRDVAGNGDARNLCAGRLRVDRCPYFTELTRRVIDGRHSGVHDCNFGLNLFLDGLEMYRDNKGDMI